MENPRRLTEENGKAVWENEKSGSKHKRVKEEKLVPLPMSEDFVCNYAR